MVLAAELSRRIRASESDLAEVLSSVATHASASAEIEAALHVLDGQEREAEWTSLILPALDISVFLPSNNLLYSYVLYALVPATWGARVRLRPSSRVKDTYFELHDVFEGVRPSIDLVDETQREFVSAARTSDLVVFTGSPTNGRAVANELTAGQTLLGMGSGPNPTVVGLDASIGKAVHDLVVSRLYNGGQDCLCSDVVFVKRSRVDEFEARLIATLERVPAGPRSTRGLVNSPLVYADAFEGASEWLASYEQQVRWRGAPMDAPLFLPSTVVRHESIKEVEVRELFSPVFNIVSYDSADEVRTWLESPQHMANGFYLSVYGEPALESPIIGNAVNCGDTSALESEDGNVPFGGYGVNASWISRGGESWGTPLLLSKEAAQYSVRTRSEKTYVA